MWERIADQVRRLGPKKSRQARPAVESVSTSTWSKPDEEFDSVIVRTSLDQVLSLDTYLLTPDGVCVIWFGLLQGTRL
jgi:hypothetical protein